MKATENIYYLLFLLLFCVHTAFAQQGSNFFVHFDKNVYSTNERTYFAGYVIREGRVTFSSHEVMSVAG